MFNTKLRLLDTEILPLMYVFFGQIMIGRDEVFVYPYIYSVIKVL